MGALSVRYHIQPTPRRAICKCRGGIRTLGTVISQYNGLAIHRWVLNRLQNFLLYSSFQRVTNQSI